MADVRLRVLVDDSSLENGLLSLNAEFNKLSKSSKDALATQAAGFKKAAEESEKFKKQLHDALAEIEKLKKQQKLPPIIPPVPAETINSIKGLKQQIKDLTNEAIKAGETSPIGQEFLKRAGEAKDRLGDLQKSVKNFSSDTSTFDGLTEGAATAAAGFSIFQGVTALAGGESEDLQKTLVKLQSSMAILNGLTQIQNALKKDSSLIQLKDNVLKGISTAATYVQATATGIYSGSLSVATVATNILNVATKALLGPIGIVLGAIALIAGAVALFSEETGKSTAEVLENVKAINALESALDSLKASAALTRGELDVELGLISQHEQDKKNLKAKFDLDAKEAGKKLNEDLLDLQRQLEEDEITDELALAKKKGELKALAFNSQIILNQKFLDEQKLLNVKNGKEEAALAKEASDEALKKQQEFAAKRLKLQEDLNNALLDLAKKAQKEELEGLDPTDRALAERNLGLAEIEELKKTIEEKGKLLDKNFKFTDEQQAQFNILRLGAETKFQEDLLAITTEQQLAQTELLQDGLQKELDIFDINRDAKIDALKKNGVAENTAIELLNKQRQDITEKFALQDLNEQEQIAVAKLDQLKRNGLTEEEFEAFKHEQLLKIQLEFAKKRLDLLIAQGGTENNLAIEQLKGTISKMEDELSNIQGKEKKFDIFSALGLKLSDEDKSKAIDAVKKVADNVKSIIQDGLAFEEEVLNRKKELAEEEIENRNDRLEQLNEQLGIEKELAEQGLANNLDLVHRQIEAEEAARQTALAQEKAILAEQEKLAKKKAAFDTLLQAINLITAASEIYKTVAPIPIVGVPLAIALIATMFGAFAAQKALAQQTTKLEKGGKLKGKTHSEGGIPLYEAEGDEWVINKTSSNKHDRILKAINEDNFASLTPMDLSSLLKGTGVKLSEEIPLRINESSATFSNSTSTNFYDMVKRMESMENHMKGFFSYYKTKPESIQLSNGTKVIKQGSVTIIKRKK